MIPNSPAFQRILKSIGTLFVAVSFFFNGATAALAEELVVIAASGEDVAMMPGTIVQAEKELQLLEGIEITLLSQTGTIVKLSGPYSGPAMGEPSVGKSDSTQKWSVALSKVAEVVSKNVERSDVIGSSRKVESELENRQPNAWLLAVDSSGHRCILPAGADMWRKDAASTVKMDLRSQSAQEKGMVWSSGEARLRLPEKFVEDGTLVVMKIDTQPRRFNIHVLPADIGKDEWGQILHWMLDSECERQASFLIDDLHTGRVIAQ